MHKTLCLFSVIAASLLGGCETAKFGGPAVNYRNQRGDISYLVRPSGGTSLADYHKNSKMLPSTDWNANRNIVFRGKSVQAVPKEMLAAIVELERLYCETMSEQKQVLELVGEVGGESRKIYLEKTGQKVREESLQKIAAESSSDPGAYVDDQAKMKVSAKADELKARAHDALKQQSDAVAILSKHGIETYRVFYTSAGQKMVRLPQ